MEIVQPPDCPADLVCLTVKSAINLATYLDRIGREHGFLVTCDALGWDK